MGVAVEDFDTPEAPDFPRANGAPMVMNPEGTKRKRMSRPSGFAKPLDDESALTNWRIDTAAFGVANSRELQARYIATKREDRKAVQALREASIQAGRGEEAAAIGTAIHAMSERWEDKSDSFNPPEPYLSALQAYEDEMTRLGLTSHLFECAFVNLEYNAAGTADRVYILTKPLVAPDGTILPAGTKIIGDLKTSKVLDYSMGAFACQLALYAQGQLYDVVNEVYLDTPEINQDWGIIVWIPSNQTSGFCQMIWVDLQAGNQAAWLAHLVKEHRKKWRQAQPVPVELADDGVAEVIEVEFGATFVTDAEMTEYIRSRMASIAKHADAKAALTKHWPEGVPSPKAGLSGEQIAQVMKLLDDVEAEFSLGWPEGDPRPSKTHTKKAGK